MAFISPVTISMPLCFYYLVSLAVYIFCGCVDVKNGQCEEFGEASMFTVMILLLTGVQSTRDLVTFLALVGHGCHRLSPIR